VVVLVAVLLGGLLAVVALAGCADIARIKPAPAPPVLPPPPPPPAATGEGTRLIVGVGELGSGFNPHLVSDQSPVSTAVATMTLPSVFHPGPGGEPQLDTTVATSASVTSTAPFTVSYELNLAASWSDNTPIAAEDFVYLWQRMRTEPGVVDSAGYRLVTDVRSRAGGKAVDVVFSQAYPQWQRMFNDLLPAHILKDAPQGWGPALAESIPVSGGPFVVTSVDRARGQIVLVRNDHYWGTPAVLDNLELRRMDPTGMVDDLRSGDLGIAQVWPDQAWLAALRQLAGSVRLQQVPQPTVVQLAMRTDQGVMTDSRVRRAVGAMLNRDTLIGLGSGNGAGGVRSDAQLMAPFDPGYRPTAPNGAPLRPDAGLAQELLTAAGYVRDAQGRWSVLGTPLKVTLGAPTDRPRYLQIAQEAARELQANGVATQVVTAPGPQLYTDPTVVPSPSPAPSSPAPSSSTPGSPAPAGAVPGGAAPGGVAPDGRPAPGAGHGPAPAPATGGARPGAAPAPVPLAPTPVARTMAAPPRPTPTPGPPAPGQPAAGQQPGQAAPAQAAPGQAAPPSTGPAPTGAPPSSSAAAAPPAAPVGVVVDLEVMPRPAGDDVATAAASNYGCPPPMAGVPRPARSPTGFCFAALQPLLDAALAGALTDEQVDATIEQILWQQLPAIPLFQEVTTLATTQAGDQAAGTPGPGPLTIGPFGGAPSWRPLAR
jgi:ABC-type transport system substrate-binding protein